MGKEVDQRMLQVLRIKWLAQFRKLYCTWNLKTYPSSQMLGYSSLCINRVDGPEPCTVTWA